MTQKKHKNKKLGFTWVLTRLAVVCAMGYLVVAFVGGQMEVAEKKRELESITAEVQQLAEENEELQRIADSGDEDAYVTKLAREKGYGKPGERQYRDISGE